jgi:hypothetical protein
MFELHEAKLREALTDDENDLVAFDPRTVDADDLHSFIGEAEDQELIAGGDSTASISAYRLACSSPIPLIAIETKWSVVAGGAIVFGTATNDEEGTVDTLKGIVEAANALYAAKTKDHRELDRLAAKVSEYADDENEYDATEICNELVRALQNTGRNVRFWTTDVHG